MTATKRRLRAGLVALAAVGGLLAAGGLGAAGGLAAPSSAPVDQTRLGSAHQGPRAEAAGYRLGRRVAAARRFAASRAGRVSFAFIDERRRVRGFHRGRRHYSASVVKAMLLVAYVRRIPGRRLRRSEKAVLGPMMKRSDNGAANRIFATVGAAGLQRLARRTGMRRFSTQSVWGLSEITPRDQARFFYRLRRFVPGRHRKYVNHVLSHVVNGQRWGVPPAKPRRWRIYFKGGWVPPSRVNQVALLRRGKRKLAIAVFTEGNPSFGYGQETIEGVARRLLRRYNRATR